MSEANESDPKITFKRVDEAQASSQLTRIKEEGVEAMGDTRTRMRTFGAEQLAIIAQLDEDGAFSYPLWKFALKAESPEAAKTKILAGLRNELARIYQDPRRSRFAAGLLDETYKDPTTKKKVYPPNIVPVDYYVEAILHQRNPFTSEYMTDDNLIKLLQHHQMVTNLAQENFKKQLPRYIAKFQNRIKRACEEQGWSVDLARLAIRIQETDFYVVDALTNLLEDDWGEFHVASGSVDIAAQVPAENQERVFTHEAGHLASGRGALQVNVPLDDSAQDFADNFTELGIFEYQKIGLKIITGTTVRFGWLNEALTEKITWILLNGSSNSKEAYVHAQQLMDLLLTSGKTQLPLLLLANAYFENYNVAAKPGEKMPAWQEMYRSINQAYSPGFLTKLDKFVKAKGIQEAIRAMQTNWVEIDNFGKDTSSPDSTRCTQGIIEN